MRIMRMLGVAVVVAIGTWFLGWWSVPLAGAIYAVARAGKEGVVGEAAVGAMVAWAALLVWQGTSPSFGRLSSAVSGVFPVPVIVLMLVAVVFSGVLAGAAARLLRQD